MYLKNINWTKAPHNIRSQILKHINYLDEYEFHPTITKLNVLFYYLSSGKILKITFI